MSKISNIANRFVVGLMVASATMTMAVAKQSDGLQTLFSFGGGNGNYPLGNLLMDKNGNLYGATAEGGSSQCSCGVVYKLASNGTETVLYSFTGGADGASPNSSLVEDKKGNLYGTTYEGGANGYGVVFQISPHGKEKVLYTFSGTDGADPFGGLIRDKAGNLYGTTIGGGPHRYGIVFELSKQNVLTTLHAFNGSNTDGGEPIGNLIMDSKANIYGATVAGGNGLGTVYELAPNTDFTLLHAFLQGSDGAFPQSGVFRDKSGNLFGTTENGGAFGRGTAFEIAADGTESVLYSFGGGNDATLPYGGLIGDSSGNLYGTTVDGGGGAGCGLFGGGTVFQLSPTGTETILHAFDCGTDGSYPQSGLIANKAGQLFGVASQGGANGDGVVFELPE